MSESSDESVDMPVELVSERDAEIASIGKDFSSYTHDGNFSVYFKLVHDRKEVEEDIKEGTFFPDYVHQFFINSERIFGYKKPVLRLFYTASRLKRYVKFDYEDKLTRERDGIEPDDIMECLSPILEGLEHTQDLNQFINDVESKEEKSFKPFGDLLHEFEHTYKRPVLLSRAQLELQQNIEIGSESLPNGKTMTNGISSSNTNGASTTNGSRLPSTSCSLKFKTNSPDESVPSISKKRYQIFHANADTVGFQQFQARMQTLIMWFIESATMVDFEDTRWDFFLVFEKYNPSTSEDPQATSVSTEDRYYFAGYSTVYKYYAYPDRTRPRVSQMLMLPPYRRNGIGTTLLQAIYDFYKKQPATLDITAEDPDEDFIVMRDFLDCKNCLKLSMFHPDQLKKGWSDDIAKEAQEELKLCHRQSRKIYEILKLNNLDVSNEEEFKSYRLEIKNRLNIPHQRLKISCGKLEKLGYELPEAMKAQRDNHKYAVAILEENFQELVRQYQRAIDKLKQSCIC